MTQLYARVRGGEGREADAFRGRSASVGGKVVEHHGSVVARKHRLSPVREVAEPGGAVDGRADVVALVAQLHFTGVHADPQPDRRQRRTLQRDRTRDPSEARAKAKRSCRPHPARRDGHRYASRSLRTSVRSSAATAAVISSGWVSHSRVEPSTSASSSVTVPSAGHSLSDRSIRFASLSSACGGDIAHYIGETAYISCAGQPPAQAARATLARAWCTRA